MKRTCVDALAIAVGTAHGPYKLKPKLDFTRIRDIADVVSVPLVLHGGSGLTDEDFRKSIACGISKINIFTDINTAAAEAAKSALEEGMTCMTDIIPYQVDAVAEVTRQKMQIFNSALTPI